MTSRLYRSLQLYWTDVKEQSISSSGLDGSDRRVLVSSGLTQPAGLAVFGQTLYWTDWTQQSIMSRRKHAG